MVNLWKAACFLSVNPDVLDQCQAAVKGSGIQTVKRTPPSLPAAAHNRRHRCVKRYSECQE